MTTIQSESNPNGLARNELAYLVNGTLRDSGILPRTGMTYLKTIVPAGSLYQGGLMYDPTNANPYLLLSIGGHLYQVPCSTDADTDLSAAFGLVNPAAQPQAYFCQAEQFAVVQAGDYVTLPLFWNGAALFRSGGITNAAVVPGTPGVNGIPAAGPMDYYMGRLWYANGRVVSAGDIVRGTSGTLANNFRDAVLNVTENPMCIGGDGFVVADSSGAIRAVRHSENLDTQLGEGRLFIFTPKTVYSLSVPVTRTNWIAADNNASPLMRVVQLTNGAVGDRSVVAVNGDLFYQSLEPSIRSLISAVRDFQQWGNTPIAANLRRLLNYQNRALMHLSSGVEWNNYLLMAMRPAQTAAGVAHDVIVPLDFMPVSSFGKKSPPIWVGHWEGLKHLQLFTGNFGGLQRCFSVAVSDRDGSIQLWELTDYERHDINTTGDSRVTMVIEFPAYNAGAPFDMKKLVTAELWLDKLLGTADFTMEYRPDGDVCWYFWHRWQLCSQADCNDDPSGATCYAETPYRESHVTTMTLPKPPNQCAKPSKRPAWLGYQFQCRLTVKGWVRVRGLLLHMEKVDRKLYANMICPTPAIVVPARPQVLATETTSQPLTTESDEMFILE